MLTKTEMTLLDNLKECVGLFQEITLDGEARNQDLSEVFHHIHYLQNRVKSQVASRMYPDTFRLMGLAFGSNVKFLKPDEIIDLDYYINLSKWSTKLFVYMGNKIRIKLKPYNDTMPYFEYNDYFKIYSIPDENGNVDIEKEALMIPLQQGNTILMLGIGDDKFIKLNVTILDELVKPEDVKQCL